VNSATCFKNNMVELISKWNECGREECNYDPTLCATIDDNTMFDEVLPSMERLLQQQHFKDAIGSETAELLSSLLENFDGYLSESMANKLDKCIAPPVDRHSAASMHGNISCDITQQSYLRSTTETFFNSTILLSLVCVIFGCFVLLVGDFESFHFQLSLVRVVCCVVGLLMSSLVYVGSWHLYQSGIDNPLQSDADMQMAWRAIYLLISYVCLHGGLLIVVPNVRGVVIVDGEKNTPSATVDQDLLCSLCGNKTCCRRGTCCFKTVYFLQDLKEQFWDASG
jgi:hypothetical protein